MANSKGLLISSDKLFSKTVLESDHKWQFVEMEIPPFSTDEWFVRVWIGNDKAQLTVTLLI